MSKNNHKEAIGLLFSGKSMKPVLIKIAQIAPAVFIRAFNECYSEGNKTEKPYEPCAKCGNHSGVWHKNAWHCYYCFTKLNAC